MKILLIIYEINVNVFTGGKIYEKHEYLENMQQCIKIKEIIEKSYINVGADCYEIQY